MLFKTIPSLFLQETLVFHFYDEIFLWLNFLWNSCDQNFPPTQSIGDFQNKESSDIVIMCSNFKEKKFKNKKPHKKRIINDS